jgi:choline dehydrogenase-like flavoprotein
VFIDLRTLPDGKELRSDVCIIGAGPAGITLARELGDAGLGVCLLESGGFETDPETQALARGESIGSPYYPLEAARLRCFGGSGNHWAGTCGPLDPIDFAASSWVPNSGWPLTRADLDPYYRRAQQVCQLGPFEYDARAWDGPGHHPLPLADDVVLSTISQHSPVRFGETCRPDIEHAKNVYAYLYANVVEIEAVHGRPEIARLRVACLGGKRFTARARVYVLAAGGIENARLLLASNSVRPAGVGNEHDLVGRYFMEHPAVTGAVFLPADPNLLLQLYEGGVDRGVGRSAFLRLAPEIQHREHLLNARWWLEDSTEQEALRVFAPGVQAADRVQEEIRAGQVPSDLGADVQQMVADLEGIAMYTYRAFFQPDRTARAYFLYTQLAQAPNPASRVTLADDRDALDMPRVQLDWRLGDLERRTLHRGVEALGVEFGRAGLGRIGMVREQAPREASILRRGPPGGGGWPPGLRGSWHHMGTTRMASDPTRGVVNADSRVHSAPNLFVAGSSVFPTSGYVNPTLTIIALALRLADHLKRELV